MVAQARRVSSAQTKPKPNPNSTSEKWNGDILDLTCIGRGISAMTFVIDDTKVIKVDFGSDQSKSDMQTERRVFRILEETEDRSPHVVICFEADNPRGVILERCQQTLRGRLRSMPSGVSPSPTEAQRWAKQAAERLAISLSNPPPESFDFNTVPHEMDLIEWCSSLVSLNKKGDILELSHFTVEEFLREDPAKISSIVVRSYLVNHDDDAFYMAETCLSYLSCQDFDQSNFILNLKPFSEFQNLYPFYCHAAVHLPDYLLALKSDPSNTPILSRFFSRENPQMFQFWSQFSTSFGQADMKDADMASWYFKGQGLTLVQAVAGFLLVSMTK